MVEVEHPAEAVLAPLAGMIIRTVLISLAAFWSAMLVGVFAARRVTEPLLSLLRALRSIRREEGRPRLPRSSTAEVAWLADELEMMRSALETRTVEMRRAFDALAQYRLLTECTTDIVLFVDHRAHHRRAERGGRDAPTATPGSSCSDSPIPDLVADPTFRLTDEQQSSRRRPALRDDPSPQRTAARSPSK